MSERPCDICKRPLWDGGHALNEDECDDVGGEVCLLRAELDSERAAHKATREERDRIRVSEQAAHASAEDAESQLAAAVEVVRRVEFGTENMCPCCHRTILKDDAKYPPVHAPDCALAAVLGAGRGDK